MKDIDSLAIRQEDGDCVIAVKVVPGSSRNKLLGVLGESLKVAVSAPAEKGRANTAAIAVLAEALGIDKRKVTIDVGRANQRKYLRFAKISADELKELLRRL